VSIPEIAWFVQGRDLREYAAASAQGLTGHEPVISIGWEAGGFAWRLTAYA